MNLLFLKKNALNIGYKITYKNYGYIFHRIHNYHKQFSYSCFCWSQNALETKTSLESKFK